MLSLRTTETHDYVQSMYGALGSFWSEVWEADRDLEALLAAAATVQRNVNLWGGQAVAAVGRQESLPHLAYTLRPWRLQEHDLQVFRRDALYGTDSPLPDDELWYLEAGSPADSEFGRSWVGPFRIPVPMGLRRCGAILDSPAKPKRVWHPGLDFQIVRNPSGWWVEFENSPFRGGRNIRYTEQGAEITLWLWQAEFDNALPEEHFGWVVGVQPTADPADRRLALINHRWDALTRGSTSQGFRQAIGEKLEVPVSKHPQETVEQILVYPEIPTGHLVVTDQECYFLREGLTPAVVVGDTISGGSFLCEEVSLHFGDGYAEKALQGVEATKLTLKPDWFGFDIDTPLTFDNTQQFLTVTTENGVTTVRFPISGQPEAVDAFWAQVDSYPNSLARELAGWTSGVPSAADLPQKVNPAQVVLEKSLQTAIALVIHADKFPDMDINARLRDIIDLLPAHVPLLVMQRLDGSQYSLQYDQDHDITGNI